MPDDKRFMRETPEERALANVRWLVKRNRQDTGTDYARLKPRPIRSVAIIGSGLMGTAIADAPGNGPAKGALLRVSPPRVVCRSS